MSFLSHLTTFFDGQFAIFSASGYPPTTAKNLTQKNQTEKNIYFYSNEHLN